MVDTQGTETKVEGAAEEPIQSQEKPTGKTYTEEDFQRAVSKGLESTQKQLDLRKAEADRAKAEAEQFKAEREHSQAYINSLKEEMEKLANVSDDPEVRQSYTSRMASLEREMKIAQRESEAERKFYEAEKKVWAVSMAKKANDLVREAKEAKLDIKDLEKQLEECNTEEEMEVKALRFMIANKGSAKEGEKPPKFDSGVGSGGGLDLSKMSPDELIRYGLTQRR